jgi:uncharacterized glyoxalase superfamily protein PhnB
MGSPMPHPSVVPALFYKDPRAAVDFIQKAFGFELDMMIEDEAGGLAHSQLRFGDGLIMVGTEWSEKHRSPARLDGQNTQTTHLYLQESVDDHCARAEAAGAVILARPETQFYGDRTYRAVDPEGHIWTFAETVKAVDSADWDKEMGFKTWTRPAVSK